MFVKIAVLLFLDCQMKGGFYIKSEWCSRQTMDYILAALMPANRLVMLVCLETGLRVGDVVALETDKLARTLVVIERKTKKTLRVKISKKLYARLCACAGKKYVFSSPKNDNRHRTRQAVWKDVKRAANLFRVRANVTPHSARKLYAVDLFAGSGDLAAVQRQLNHSDSTVTLIYALADQLARKL